MADMRREWPPLSMAPFDDIPRQVTQRLGCRVERSQGVQGLVTQFQGVRFGGAQPEQGRIGRFVPGDIGALAFAQRRRVTFHVENVVLYLEGQANSPRIGVQGGQVRRLGSATGQGAQVHRGFDQGAGLVAVHMLEGLSGPA